MMLSLGLSLVSPTVLRSGVSVAALAGAALLLVGETDGLAMDFTYSDNTKRIAVTVGSVTTEYEPDAFLTNAGTSPKLVYDATGTLVWSPHNMVLQSENLAVTWVSSAGTPIVTANTIEDDNTVENEGIRQSITTLIGATYTVSAWFLKTASKTAVPSIFIDSTLDCVAQIDTVTGSSQLRANTLGGTGIVTDRGTHWELSVTFVADAVSILLTLRAADNVDLSASGNNAALGIVTIDRVWMNRGTVPTAYLATTTAARYGVAIDHDPVTLASRGLLVEPAATNLHLYGRDLTNVGYAVANLTAARNAVGADGVANGATTLTASNTSTSIYYNTAMTVVASTAYTLSFLAKAGTATGLQYAIYDISNAAFIHSDQAYTAGSGEFARIERTFTTPVGCVQLRVYVLRNLTGSTGTVIIDMVQVELGSVATSPIPTFGAAVTRAADDITALIASFPYSATEGTYYADVSLNEAASTGSSLGIFSAGTGARFLYTNSGRFVTYDGTATLDNGAIALGRSQLTNCYGALGRRTTKDGSITATGTFDGAMTPTGLVLHLGRYDTGQPVISAHIRRFIFAPRQVPLADVATWRYAA